MRTLLLMFIFIVVGNHNLVAKSKWNMYANQKYWKVMSIDTIGKTTSSACVIESKRQAVLLGYTGSDGWKLTGFYKKKMRLKNDNIRANFYVDKRYVGSVDATIVDSDKMIHFFLGLDTKILNPIFKGKFLSIKVAGIFFNVKLSGIKRAYNKALGCWRERMDSIPYVATGKNYKKTNKKLSPQNTKQTIDLTDLKGIALSKIFATGIGFWKIK